MNKIPKYILHYSILRHHLIKQGFNDVIPTLNDNWYFDINKRTIVLEGA